MTKFQKYIVSGNSIHANLIVYFVFLVFLWLTFYLKFRQFGLYEDDYWLAGIPATSSFTDLVEFIKTQLFNQVENRGRYVAAVLPFIVTHVNYNIGGLPFLYIFGIFLVSFNAWLIFKILKGSSNFEFAFLTGIIFILYPADTTKALIVHIYHLQISLAFTLTGMWLYVRNYKVAGYLIAFISMVNYENAFLPFTLVPLIENLRWDKSIFRKLFKHWIIIGAFFVLLFLVRKFSGETTINDMELTDIVYKTLASLVAGPLTAFASFFIAAYAAIANPQATWILVLAAIVILSLLYLIMPGVFRYTEPATEFPLQKKWGIGFTDEQWRMVQAVVIGALITVVGYSFAFPHFPPTVLAGRMTSVHLGGAMGISMVLAGLIRLLLLSVKNASIKRYVVVPGMVLFLALQSGYGMLIQNDYIKSRNIQSTFWNQVINICPDLKENTLILVKRNSIVETKYVVSFSWASPIILENMYDFPKEWQRNPKLEIIDVPLSEVLSREGDSLFFLPHYVFMYDYKNRVGIRSNDLIVLELNEVLELTRLTDSISLGNGITIPLRIRDNAFDPDLIFEQKPLYGDILGN